MSAQYLIFVYEMGLFCLEIYDKIYDVFNAIFETSRRCTTTKTNGTNRLGTEKKNDQN